MTTAVNTHIIDIMVTGIRKTGKSSFIRSLAHQARYSDGWLSGVIPVDQSLDAHFIEPPSIYSADFHWLREMIEFENVPGYIVMLDSTRPETFGKTVAILQVIRAYHPKTPIVLACNHQDNQYAWSAKDIRLGLGIPSDIIVKPCIATDMQQVKKVVIDLLYAIWEI